ncbi:MAG: hypothetical protein EOP36_20565 [Rubrivivax sp.]|nr:MAG: hypothetical protein EOP36_20565 [Rubrivivax sp.]
MSLQAARDKAFEQIFLAKDVINERDAVTFFELWLEALKLWEMKEDFETAFQENRMCMRAAPADGAAQTKQSFTPNAVRTENDVLIRASVPHTPLFLDPKNFLLKKKNELGLHDVSAVLLSSDKKISAQVFPKVGRQPLFIPIPHEKDLLLLHCIGHMAKQNKAGPIYEFYKNASARITRIKYGSEDDMKTTFLKTVDSQQKVHYRYGDAHETAGPVSAQVLQERRSNALFYQSRVLTGKVTENNEVTLKIRQHAGNWPQAAVPGPVPPSEAKSMGLPCEVPKDHFLLVGFDLKFKSLVNDEGKIVKRL